MAGVGLISPCGLGDRSLVGRREARGGRGTGQERRLPGPGKWFDFHMTRWKHWGILSQSAGCRD